MTVQSATGGATASGTHPIEPPKSVPAWVIPLLAAACGITVANLYFAQPLVGPIAAALQLSPGSAGLIVTLVQAGYCLGLLLLVPLADLVENRRLVCRLLAGNAVALTAAAFASHAVTFLLAAWLIGLCSVAVQVLVPFAAHLAPDHARGRAVGSVTSGLLLGIMLARPIASIVADLWGWHAIFALSAVVMALLSFVLARRLPKRTPPPGLRYAEMLASMWQLLRTQPVLRRRAAYQASMFGAFSLFWTTAPLYLSGPAFGLSQRGIALFALAGVAGAIAAPIAGRLADRGRGRRTTAIALLLGAASLLIGLAGTPGSMFALAMLTVAAIVLDFGLSASLVVSQRAIFSLSPEHRGRLNGVFMALFFVGGALGSALGGWAYAHGGWPLASGIGFAMPILALLYFASERP
ncbi:sugar efflux transporter [Cupriavidus yeoncheonensis]|uniref:Sugar efflux transporter n=1 Tax=Cupriavidus yeoncheonensis TaxID=1462994 RepID=A0A916MXJ7_9BURK|nr:MFS transporter [Cupriavidus yeoncheonensis]CAG2154804.1 sugar efflux transporter [Cupriavidus yeoncheonensis]